MPLAEVKIVSVERRAGRTRATLRLYRGDFQTIDGATVFVRDRMLGERAVSVPRGMTRQELVAEVADRVKEATGLDLIPAQRPNGQDRR